MPSVFRQLRCCKHRGSPLHRQQRRSAQLPCSGEASFCVANLWGGPTYPIKGTPSSGRPMRSMCFKIACPEHAAERQNRPASRAAKQCGRAASQAASAWLNAAAGTVLDLAAEGRAYASSGQEEDGGRPVCVGYIEVQVAQVAHDGQV